MEVLWLKWKSDLTNAKQSVLRLVRLLSCSVESFAQTAWTVWTEQTSFKVYFHATSLINNCLSWSKLQSLREHRLRNSLLRIWKGLSEIYGQITQMLFRFFTLEHQHLKLTLPVQAKELMQVLSVMPKTRSPDTTSTIFVTATITIALT